MNLAHDGIFFTFGQRHTYYPFLIGNS